MRIYPSRQEYQAWVRRYDTFDDRARGQVWASIRRLERFPLFSILPESGGVSDGYCSAELMESLRHQLYPYWEVVLLPDGDAAAPGSDRRVRVARRDAVGADAANGWSAMLGAAQGDYILPLPSDARLAEHALYELAAAIGRDPQADLVYGDEDRIGSDGERHDPWFKTGWDPDLALEPDAIGVPAAHRSSLLRALVGSLPPASRESSRLYALSLHTAFASSPARIHHVPAILRHRSDSVGFLEDQDTDEIRAIVRAHLARNGIAATVEAAPAAPRSSWVRRDLPDPAPLVTIIVPTRDRADLLERCVASLLLNTDYPALELLIVDNDSREPAAIALLRRLSSNPLVRVLPYPGEFNYAAMNNYAAREAQGSILLLLNNDTEAIRPDWLGAMVAHAVRPDVGAVGARLLYPDGRVQHAGMVFQPGVGPVHQFRFAARDDPGPSGVLCLTRSVTIVTGACLALRRAVYHEAGGLDEGLRVAFNDVDLCMRLGDHGYRIVWTPAAELYHFESASRGYDVTPEQQTLVTREFDRFRRRWGSLPDTDPFRNPNLDYGWNRVGLAAPPLGRPGRVIAEGTLHG